MERDILYIVGCLFGSAFFSATETALTALPLTRLEARRACSRRLTKAGLDRWATAPQQVLISILIGNNLVNVLASALATKIAYQLSEVAGLAIVVGGMTLIILVFGEITPKTLAQSHAEAFSVRIAPILYVIDMALRPASWLLGLLTRVMPKGDHAEAPVNEADLMFMLGLAHRHSLLAGDAHRIIESVLQFRSTVAREVMAARPQVVTIEAAWSADEVRAFVAESVHTRFPVVDGSPDRIIGVLHSRQLNRLGPDRDWHELITEPYYIPEGKAVPKLMQEFRETGQHLAIVLDEFGGLAGVVSLEDALELLVGEIDDEFDHQHGATISRLEDGWIVPGHLGIRRLERLTDTQIVAPDGVDSIGGLTATLLDEPEIGDHATVSGLVVEVRNLVDGRPSEIFVTPAEKYDDRDD